MKIIEILEIKTNAEVEIRGFGYLGIHTLLDNGRKLSFHYRMVEKFKKKNSNAYLEFVEYEYREEEDIELPAWETTKDHFLRNDFEPNKEFVLLGLNNTKSDKEILKQLKLTESVFLIAATEAYKSEEVQSLLRKYDWDFSYLGVYI